MDDTIPDTQTQYVLSQGQSLSQRSTEDIPRSWGRLNACTSFLSSIDLIEDSITFGRLPECKIVVNNLPETALSTLDNISKKHFCIHRDQGGFPIYITDKSKNGTFLNNRRIGRGKTNILQTNDTISICQEQQQVYIFQMIGEVFDHLPKQLREHYVPSSSIGKGACGEVILAYHKISCKPYAIKKIVKGRSSENIHQLNHPDKIDTEISILRRLEHPCIISMIEIVDTGEQVYIVLEYMPGGELTSRIFSFRLSESQIKYYFYQMLLAVQYLHGQGITHRDLKPENVLLSSKDDDAIVKITDFGLSKIMSEHSLMQTICGTPYYVAPEILDTRFTEYSQQVDVWSLGVMLFFMLTGHLPFEANDKRKLNVLIITGAIKWNDDIWQLYSPNSKHLVQQMLRVNPEQRITIARILKHPWLDQDTVCKNNISKILKMQTENREYFDSPPLKKLKTEYEQDQKTFTV